MAQDISSAENLQPRMIKGISSEEHKSVGEILVLLESSHISSGKKSRLRELQGVSPERKTFFFRDRYVGERGESIMLRNHGLPHRETSHQSGQSFKNGQSSQRGDLTRS